MKIPVMLVASVIVLAGCDSPSASTPATVTMTAEPQVEEEVARPAPSPKPTSTPSPTSLCDQETKDFMASTLGDEWAPVADATASGGANSSDEKVAAAVFGLTYAQLKNKAEGEFRDCIDGGFLDNLDRAILDLQEGIANHETTEDLMAAVNAELEVI
jgi:hypothetical protein